MGIDEASDWGPLRRHRAADQLAALARRQRIVESVSHPAELLAACDGSYRITPAVELVSRKIERVLRGRRRRLLITAPPQEFKSTLCAVGTPLRALQLHPDWRVMLLTYADGLAEEHSLTARGLVREYGSGVVDSLTGQPLPDRLGLSLSEDKATAGNWRIREGGGGLVAAGRDATVTGKRADLLLVDDPFKNMQEADSATMRQKIYDWYRSVATTRLSAEGSVILIQTRWNPEDLAGQLLSSDRELPPELREWHYVNIPAVSHPALPDALGREPGVALESARGRTPEDYAAIERNVGRRIWSALYQGSPTPPEGGLFTQSWFDDHRIEERPDRTRVRIVAVDPSESGEGDEAGVIAASMLTDGRIVLTDDRSAAMTSDQWATAAVQLALDTDASDIFIETYTAGTTYINVVKSHIRTRAKAAGPATANKLAVLVHRVRPWRGTGDSVARSGLLRQAIEVGSCAVLGHNLTTMEEQARHWQQGQHQPDRVAASVIAHDRLVAMAGKVAQIGDPTRRGGPSGRNTWLDRKVG